MPRIQRKPEAPAPEAGARILAWRSSGAEHGAAVDSVLARLRPRILAASRERVEAPRLLAELLRQSPERREMLVRNSGRFRNLPLCGLLLERSYRENLDAPRQGERLAALALRLVESLDPAWYGDRVLADARARCWMLIANARRVSGELHRAEEAFETAEDHLRRGTGDRLARARLLSLRACLRRAQRRFDEAARLFRRAISIFLSAREPHRAADAIVGLALVEQYRGEPERANGLVDPREEPRLLTSV